ncbi:MAG: hypothetical protein A2Y38_10205 [Spirochaetes bacterium GWB1_59_5]|nr:MAG: hypothetical protein A2Y38_10205 [Spirochaetes bacterium GWB1_59_5]
MIIRLLDILFSLVAILLLSPVLGPMYLILKLTGQHQAFYVQPRVGKGGKDFGVFKFVTMVSNAEHMAGGYLTQKNDPRVLPLGKFLRKTKINELPQLFNILFGQMSFVGPRPQARPHYDLYSPEVKQAIDAVPPGLTGIGSVVFRDEEDILNDLDNDRNHFHDTVIAPYKGLLELWYCGHRNLRTYFQLLLLTGWTLARPRTVAWLRLFPDVPRVPPALRIPLGVERFASALYPDEFGNAAS